MSFPAIDDLLLRKLDRPTPRYTSYPTAPTWRDDFLAPQHGIALARAAQDAGPLSLYVHVPFCREMCSYCGCNVVVSKDQARAGRYVEVVIEELALLAQHLGARRQLSRVHLGGGTPTFLDERQLERLMQGIRAHFSIEPGAELAIEIDPVVTRPSQIELLAQLGFRRMSLGVQDFDPAVQDAVNRHQTVEETARAVAHARAVGFTSVNFDLIYGLPLQRPETWSDTIARVIALAPDRLAVYSFAYLPEQRPNQRRLPSAGVPFGRAKLDLLRIAYDALLAAGYDSIGIDHFARPDDELARARRDRRLWRDFQGYTVRRAGDTVAAGVSGISTLDGAIVQSMKHIGEHAGAVHAGHLPTERGLFLSDDDRARRDIITQLMCNDWIDLGAGAETRFAPELARLRVLEDDGLCTLRGGEITLTPLGRLFARLPAAAFDAYLPQSAPCVAGPRYSQTV